MRHGNHFRAVLIGLLITFFCFSDATSHPGGRDNRGGHWSSQAGKYHFHEGPLSGVSFPSKEKAYQALDNLDTPKVRIASFNIRIFSNKSRDDKELNYICDILKEYDLIAIQELRDTQVLNRTLALLDQMTGAKWAFEASKPVGHGVKELYAFLYRKDRVHIIETGKLIDDPNDEFIREPYYATFASGHFDFTIITIHALYKSKNAPEREKEFNKLASVFINLRKGNPREQDLILMGDFNDPPENLRFKAIREVEGMVCLFQEPMRTTIADTSLYDNMCFQKNYVSEYTSDKGINKFDETVFNRNYGAAKLAVSDHRPVWAVFSTIRDDD